MSTPVSQSPQQENQEEVPTADDKLVEQMQEEAQSQEAKMGLMGMIGFAGAGIIHGGQVKQFLNEPIDVNKLLTDHKYRAHIEEISKSTGFWGWAFRKDEWEKKYKATEKAIKKVERAEKITARLERTLTPQYLAELKNVYGLSDNQVEAVKKRAEKLVKDHPNALMGDVARAEASSEIWEKTRDEVNQDKQIKDKRKEIKKRLDAKDKSFAESAAHKSWEDRRQRVRDKTKTQILQEGGNFFEDKQPAQPQSAPTPEPATSSLAPSSAPSTPSSSPPAPPHIPTTSTGGFSGIKNFFSGLKGGLKGMLSGIKDQIKNIVGLLKGALSLAKSLISGVATGGAAFIIDAGLKLLKWLGKNLKPLLKRFLGKLGEKISEFMDPEAIAKFAFSAALKIVVVIVLVLLVIMLTASNNTNLAAPGTSTYNME